jgi:CIC family chloride channel protein
MNQKKSVKNYSFLFCVAFLIGILSTLLGISLKHLTEFCEDKLFSIAADYNIFFIIFPILGLYSIYITRHLLFKNKGNKGIKEILEGIRIKGHHLPFYKIPSHYINGLLTVASGGSTGIEVSTVVASAAIGSVFNKKLFFLKEYRTEFICAGSSAAIVALFNSPAAGILFSFEVISKRVSKLSLLMLGSSVTSAYIMIRLFNEAPLFTVTIDHWNTYAIPFFILLGIISGLNSVYLTKSVIFFKRFFGRFDNEKQKIMFGALICGLAIFIFPQLFGEGYHIIREILNGSNEGTSTLPFALGIGATLVLKPIVTSITLSSGGDGGIFAPSLFIGAFLGLLVAFILNQYFHANVIPVNFMIIGMAAVLSSSMHAPFTAMFLVCGLIGSYSLFIPLGIACITSVITAKKIIPYTVYNYK